MTRQATQTAAAAEITPELVVGHGLSEDEYAHILDILGREPNLTELGIFSVMWSEHCSYKSSKKYLKTLPTEAPWVICGPGENAGVIDIGDGLAAVFKMESHNHPSFIEPYQGAATGVGGILRDVFTMGARPVANLNALRFGSPDHPKTRHLVAGVVAGIGGYGNCMGIPTIGGECQFDQSYNGNILVNAMTVGLAPADLIFYSAATGAGNLVAYVGSKTGRDGIHGATMASAEFDAETDAKRPTVQVGDPFTEKLLLEACLELMASDAIVAIQDMGAAGLTCSTFEMADKGGTGIEMDLDQVPVREPDMSAYEIMLSESQERMVMVLKPGREDEARAVFEKWELDFSVVGHLTDSGRMVLKQGGEVVADLPIAPLAEASPEYDRPWEATPSPAPLPAADINPLLADGEALLRLLACPDLCAKNWIWEQYDHMVMGDTVERPGGDAGVLRIHNSNRGLAVTSDCSPRYCYADPESGGAQAVAEAWRNLTAAGARPLAITDCMNFGNPERPEIMGQFVGCIEGMRAACQALDFPVVSGNVSFYNETNGEGIIPTPTIGGVGVIDDLSRSMTLSFKAEDEAILLVGETTGHLGATAWLREVANRRDGAPPAIDLNAERRNGDFTRGLIENGLLTACHDVASGGIAVALAEMAISGGLGAIVTIPKEDGIFTHGWLFAEDQGRYLLTASDPAPVIAAAQKADVTVEKIGKTGGHVLTLTNLTAGDTITISVSELERAHQSWLPGFMAIPDEN
ncbi:MAG: phosphoribosylformylglycinamidine synthase subunit PurL [Alphaproteobacteria bacterium]|jgi:phosphoribosylformylglycinamidine synthase|nr:phosphoribosylformylglycinamidine synthase subunit PurL [Alphaproteobacteria bacterium]MDP7191157.1 phosphoribosylformylglycinamidine synthase subunit PurL [Alphaproteobacteria bacterium]MDP7456645.1 phosphoribosylformylglycinamidine synthase subunit PurL [Alphaproteobacteria bacterium]HJO88642.1 phosphoribosylformylglycinamidine synthase subunit PurL [Alphaproteobacteria bacterium]